MVNERYLRNVNRGLGSRKGILLMGKKRNNSSYKQEMHQNNKLKKKLNGIDEPSKQDRVKELIKKQQQKRSVIDKKVASDDENTSKTDGTLVKELKELQNKYAKLEKRFNKQSDKLQQTTTKLTAVQQKGQSSNLTNAKAIKGLNKAYNLQVKKNAELQQANQALEDTNIKLQREVDDLGDSATEVKGLRAYRSEVESVLDRLENFRKNYAIQGGTFEGLKEYRPPILSTDNVGDFYVKWLVKVYHYLRGMEIHYQKDAISLLDDNPKLLPVSKKKAKQLAARKPVLVNTTPRKDSANSGNKKNQRKLNKLQSDLKTSTAKLKVANQELFKQQKISKQLDERLRDKHESDHLIAINTYDTDTLVEELKQRMTLGNIVEFELMDDVVLKYRELFINHVKGNSAKLVNTKGKLTLEKASKHQRYPELFGYFWKTDDDKWVFNDLEDNLYTDVSLGTKVKPGLGFIYRVAITSKDKVLLLKKYKAISKHETTKNINNQHRSRRLKKIQHDEDLGIYNPYADTTLSTEFLTEQLQSKKILIVSWHKLFGQRDNLERYGAKVTTLDSKEESEVYLASQINSSQYDLVLVDINGISHSLSKLLSFRLFSDEGNNVKLVNHINKDDAVIIASQYFENKQDTKLNLLDLVGLTNNQSSKEY